MKPNTINNFTSVLISLLSSIVGILFIVDYESFWFLIYIIIISYITISLIKKLLIKKIDLTFIIDIIAMLVLFYYGKLYYNLIHILVGWWIIFNGIVCFIEYYIARRDLLPNSLSNLIKAVINTIVGLTLIFNIVNSPKLLSIIIGLYLILLSFFDLGAVILDVIPMKFSQRFSLSMPVIFSILLPQKLYISIENLIKKEKIIPNENLNNSNIEILIHLKSDGTESVGHVDVAIDEYVYSYGLHDPSTRELFGTLGDGVLIKANKKLYIDQSVHQEDKMVLSYKLNVNKKQKDIIYKRLNQLMENTIPWMCEAESLKKENKQYNKCFDYASRVYRFTNSEMFKFKSGKFKTYFLATTNCVLLSDYLIRSKELNLITVNGIVTPGTYLQFLSNEYRKKSSIITEFYVFSHHNLNELYTLKTYNGLNGKDDYRLVRKSVFIDEQKFSTDIDDIDIYSTHVVVYYKKTPVGTGRVFQDENKLVHIGRICVVKEHRNKNLASYIMNELEIIGFSWNDTITLTAQTSAKNFYYKLGYKEYGKEFYDEWCPHINMKKRV